MRKAGRYSVFPRTALSGAVGRTGPRDGLVEIWNGMPFFSPLWARCPRIVFLHHVHAEMWRMVLPPRLARIGERSSSGRRRRFYRAHADRDAVRVVKRRDRRAAADAARQHHGLPAGDRPALLPRRRPSRRAPLIVAVGRLVPVKRFDLLVERAVPLKARHRAGGRSSSARGTSARRSRPWSAAAAQRSGCKLPGRVDDDELLDLYRRAWVLASARRARAGA